MSRTARPAELPKVLTRAQLADLMAVPNLVAPTGLRNRCMLELMVRSGLRVSECCGLHLRDVRWGDGQIHLRPEITKGNVEAMAYIDEPTEQLLERWLPIRRQHAARKPHLFTTLQGGPVSRKYVWSMIGRYARRAGLEHLQVHPHMLRHTYATLLLRDGFSVPEVQKLLRHADIRTTQIYTHVVDADLLQRIRART